MSRLCEKEYYKNDTFFNFDIDFFNASRALVEIFFYDNITSDYRQRIMNIVGMTDDDFNVLFFKDQKGF